MSVRRKNENIYSPLRESKFKRHVAQYRTMIAIGGVSTLYSEAEFNALEKAEVCSRLPPRTTNDYLDLARRSRALGNLNQSAPRKRLKIYRARLTHHKHRG
jgi:hypothetical protein